MGTGILGRLIMLPSFFVLPRCAIPGLDNDTYKIQDSRHQWLINQTIPDAKDGYERCKMYNTTSPWDQVSPENRTTIACDRWVFDKEVFETTATEKVTCNVDIPVKLEIDQPLLGNKAYRYSPCLASCTWKLKVKMVYFILSNFSVMLTAKKRPTYRG